MSLKNPIIFGLEAQRNLAEIPNTNLALRSLNLNILDFDVIRGSKNAGASETDFRGLSGLNQPLFRRLGRYVDDSGFYESLIAEKAGYSSSLFGNLTVFGSVDGNAVRFRYVAVDNSGNRSIGIADISTSRVSSWSSSASPVIASSPISYGAQVAINTSGELRFGTQDGTTGTRLQTTITPEEKEFASELPTHKIEVTIDNNTRSFYAMKGIPITFTGFFRKVSAKAQLTSLISNIAPSWKISQLDGSGVTKFTNQGGTTSEIEYKSSVSRERNIQFYYNPDNISLLEIPNAQISELPISKFQNLRTFNLINNNLTNFPDLTDVAPNLRTLVFSRNPFYLSDNPNERRINDNIVNKIPEDLTSLTLGGSFGEDIPKDILGRFTNLRTLNLAFDSGRRFVPSTNPGVCTCPNVPSTVTNYDLRGNDFRNFDASPGTDADGNQMVSVETSTTLVNLNLSDNANLRKDAFSIASGNNAIRNVFINRTRLPIPDLSGKSALERFHAINMTNVQQSLGFFTSGNTYKFDNCNALVELRLRLTNMGGAFPKFTNSNLKTVTLRNTKLVGGEHNGSTQHVLPELTFQNAPEIATFQITSDKFLKDKPIHPNAFTFTPKLSDIWWNSARRTNGEIKDLFKQCPVLRIVRLYTNAFTGNCPNFQQQKDFIYYVHLGFNKLSGDIPALANLSQLYQLRLYNNNFTGIKKFTNLPRLRYCWFHNNQITGKIPDFSDCPRLYYLVMYNNQFTTYESGSFKTITQIRYLDVGRNSLTQTSINQIVTDLYDNYLAAPRGSVVINLSGGTNAAPSGPALDLVTILESNGWDIRSN